MDDAAKIINDAASAARPRIEVLGAQRGYRDPYRTIEIVEVLVPPCTIACPRRHRCYPEGATLMVHPRQVQAHLRLYPGARVLRHLRHQAARRVQGSGVAPRGHRDPREFLAGKQVLR